MAQAAATVSDRSPVAKIGDSRASAFGESPGGILWSEPPAESAGMVITGSAIEAQPQHLKHASALLPQEYRGVIAPAIHNLSRQGRSSSIEAFEGYVCSISDECIYVTLSKLYDDSEFEAEIPLEEISPEDRELVVEGAVFYWHIGYETSPSGQRTRYSEIRFRRLPVWSANEIEQAKIDGQKLAESLIWD